jgi:ABC-type Mn2+/Zn2+ transport system permease subunit
MPALDIKIIMLNTLLSAFQEEFFLRALLALFLSGISAACLGSYIILRRMSFISTAMTHSILPGVVLAVLLGFSAYWGALIAALLTAAGIAWISSRKGSSEDSAIGVMLSVMFALGIAFMGLSHSWRDFTGLLFGSIVSVSTEDIGVILGTTFIVLFCLRLLHKELELASFDEEYAHLLGARPALLRSVLLILIALAAVASVRLVGALLTTALFIIPSTTGVLIGKNLKGVMFWSVLCACGGGTLGLIISYTFQGIPAGAAIVLGCAIPYIIVRIKNA